MSAGLVALEHGLRSETDRQTGLTTLYRNREMVLGLVGGKCSKCGTLQFPKSNVCVNPSCHAADAQEDHPFSEMPATMRSYTADRLTYSVAPPAYYDEVYLQMLGRAGERQREEEPVMGLTHNLGGFPHRNVCSVVIVGREGA